MLVSLDTETDSLNPRKATCLGFSYYMNGVSTYICHKTWNGVELVEVTPFSECVTLLKTLLPHQLVLHNTAYDAQVLKNYFGVDILPSVYIDTLLLSHTINENESNYGLKYLASKYLSADSADDQTTLKEHLKSIGAKANEFYKADRDIMSRYAKKDAELTYKLATLLLNDLEKQNLNELFFEEIMPLYKTVVIPMQARGVMVDLPLLQQTQSEMAVDMDKFHIEILNNIKPLLDEFYNWFYAKNYPLKTRGKVFSAMQSGLSLRQAQEACAKADGTEETFNILSKTHLKRLFFDILKLEPLSTTDLGAPQVDDEFLKSIEETHSWVKDLRLYNRLTKVKSSYVDRFIEEQEDGIFYPDYQMHRTTTGRLAGDFQQLPKILEKGHPLLLKYNNRIRDFFISRPGKILIDSDYESLEPHIFAHLAGDETLLNIFRTGVDFYSQVAIATEGLEGYSADKSAPNYLGEVNQSARQKAKGYALGIRYGLDDYKLHKDLGISQQEAQRLVKQYFTSFPKLAKSMEDARINILSSGKVSNMFGRIRRNPEIPRIYAKHGNAILNALDLWKKYNETPGLYKQAKEDYKKVRAGINNAYNFEVQSTAAHIVNRASIEIAKTFKILKLDAEIVGQCHDELLIECDESIKKQVAAIMQDKMENTTKLSIDLPAIPQYGYKYSEVK